MAGKNPFDYSNMFQMFDPDDIRKYFDPTKMFSSVFEPQRSSSFDMSSIFDSNRKNFDAMLEANKAAAAAYQDLLAKQMDVFGQLTTAAREHVAFLDDATGPEAMSKKTEAYGDAVEKALVLMRKLADSAREANEEAYASLKSQVADAMVDLQKKSK